MAEPISCFGSCARGLDRNWKTVAVIYAIIMALFITVMATNWVTSEVKGVIGLGFGALHIPILLLIAPCRDEIASQRRKIKHEEIEKKWNDRKVEEKSFEQAVTEINRADAEINAIMGASTEPTLQAVNKDVNNLIFTADELPEPIMEGSFLDPKRVNNDSRAYTFYTVKYKARDQDQVHVITLYQKEMLQSYGQPEWIAIGATEPLFGAGRVAVTGLNNKGAVLKRLVEKDQALQFCLA